MESGTPGKTTEDGWLNRALNASRIRKLRRFARSRQERSCRVRFAASRAAIAVSDSQQYQMGNQDAASILESMYATTTGPAPIAAPAMTRSRR